MESSSAADVLKKAWHRVANFFETTQNVLHDAKENVFTGLNGLFYSMMKDPTLEDTLVEKIGGGPHGYGDPRDTSLRQVEDYLFPRMIWKKIRFGKCMSVVEGYYACIYRLDAGEVTSCSNEEKAMFDCKSFYYSPEQIDLVEEEVKKEYIKLRSKFRETGSEEDLWQLKMLMLEPFYDELHRRRMASQQEPEKSKDHSPQHAAST